MHLFSATSILVVLQILSHTGAISALMLPTSPLLSIYNASQTSANIPLALAKTLFNDAVALVEGSFNETNETLTTAQSPLNGTLAPIQSLFNGTVPPSDDFIPFRVSESRTTLLFHSFGASMPSDELLQSITSSISVVFDRVIHDGGRTPMLDGFFRHTHHFINDDYVKIVIADFREDGRPITYFNLVDIIRGIGDFMIEEQKNYMEVQFEVEVDHVGYAGTGHVEYTPAATPTPALS
ncbi:hypothetical protein MMC28_004092 [Mycoblastus sanguinarius]|nr:hypothetical protein [Mycoblastus sanguinarius]